MTFLELLRYNLPSEKPELWDHLLRSLPRHASYRWQRWFSPKRLGKTRVITYDETLQLRVQLDDVIGRSIYLYGVYENAVTHLLHTLLKPGQRFMDIGANLGYYALYAAKRVGITGKVMAFEPVPELYQELSRNVALNSFTDILAAEPSAVCDRNAPVSLFVHFEPDNRGLSSLAPQEGSFPMVTVPGVTLDSAVEQMPGRCVDLMKVDVEGCEDQVFNGGRRVLTSPGAPDIIFESHDPLQTIPVLENFGYTVYDIAFRGDQGVAISPYGRYPLSRHHRFYDPPNFFATKSLREDLRRLLV